MKLGVHLVNFSLPGGAATIGPTLADVGAAAEEAGVANLSAMDHYLQIGGMGRNDAESPMLEGYTTLGVPRRPHPHASSCSCWSPASPTGIPACWPRWCPRWTSCPAGERCWASARPGTNASTPPTACRSRRLRERFERLEETLQIVHQMWSADDGPFTAGTTG